MQNIGNTLQNNALTAMARHAAPPVLQAIANASKSSGVDFAYLLQQAKAESSFDPSAKARTSSATGLFQFINSTWMTMVERYGEKYGIDMEGKTRQDILDLRKDATISSNMAAEFAGENERYLNRHWGGEAGSTELYFAHFLGAPKAASFLNARDANPEHPAAVIFPKAAKANYNVFYDRATGRAKSIEEVYAYFDKKFAIKDADPDSVLPEAEVLVAENDAETQSKASDSYSYGSLYNAQLVQASQRSANSVLFSNANRTSPSIMPFYDLIKSPLEVMLMSQVEEQQARNDDNDRQQRARSSYNS